MPGLGHHDDLRAQGAGDPVALAMGSTLRAVAVVDIT